MTVSHWQRPHSFSTPDLACDVVVIGGGFVGLSTAYWLSELRPGVKVIVLEKSTLGSGASGRNAGFLTKGSSSFFFNMNARWGSEKTVALHKYADTSLQLLHQIILKASPEIKFERSSSLTLEQNESPHHEPLPKLGFVWKRRDDLPLPLAQNFEGAWESSPEYKINPMQLLNSLRTKLESRKIQVVENVSAFDLQPGKVSTDVNEIKTKQVILALNGYLPQFHPSFRNIVVPRRAQMLAVELQDDLDTPGLHYDPVGRIYWRKGLDKILLIGGKRVLDTEGETGDFEKVSTVVQEGLEEYLRDVLELKYKVIHRWSGIMGFTEHELPLIQKVEAPIETFVVGGFSGHGMGFGFHAAKEVSELSLGLIEESFFARFHKLKLKL